VTATRRASPRPRAVLTAIARIAARLCEAGDAVIFQVEGDGLCVVAKHGSFRSPHRFGEIFPLSRNMVVGRAILDRRTIHVRDLLGAAQHEFKGSAAVHRGSVRTMLVTPLMRGRTAIGAIVIRRTKVRPFTAKQIALLRTFADQAAMAIENAQLVGELGTRNADLTEALEQQTATSEILRVISSSPTDVQPVLDAVAESAARLCGATDALIQRVEGDVMRRVAHFGPVAVIPSDVRPVTRDTPAGRAIVERRTIHLDDILEEFARGEYLEGRTLQRGSGFRTILATPLVREDAVIGVIVIRRVEVRPFTAKQMELLKTFADQAVIAIENVRLFTELNASNSELRVALEQQTATSEILRVISSSPTDLQPVFDAIASSSTRLCDAAFSVVFRFDGELITVAADDGRSPGTLDVIRSAYPAPPGRRSIAAQTILERRVISIADAQSSAEYPHAAERARAIGYRSILSVPMLRGDAAIGAINVARLEAIPFTDTQITLLQTFADQAVIAIQNVRLFTELEARNAELTEALEQQTATSEILRVISSSPTDVQPVFDTIARSAMRLCDGTQGVVSRYDGELLHLAAHAHVTAPC
jgi:GAF domain-containing protein